MTNSKNKTAADAIKGYQQAVAFGKENVDAVMKSNAILAKGIQDINTVLFDLAQTALQDSVVAAENLFGCKTVAEVMDTQAGLAKTGYAKALDDSRKISELTTKVAEAASRPITSQVNAAVEKFSKPMSA